MHAKRSSSETVGNGKKKEKGKDKLTNGEKLGFRINLWRSWILADTSKWSWDAEFLTRNCIKEVYASLWCSSKPLLMVWSNNHDEVWCVLKICDIVILEDYL